MPKFKATVIRTVHQIVEIEFDADDLQDAKGKARLKTHDVDFSGFEKSSEYIYKVENVRKTYPPPKD